MHEPNQVQGKETIADQISNDFDTFEAGMIQHWRGVVAIAVVIILAVAVFAVTRHVLQTREAELEKAFANAQTIEQLQKIIAENPKFHAVSGAELKLAGLFIQKEEYEKAYQELQKVYTAENIDFFLRAKAGVDSAYMLELLGKNEQAITLLDAIIANPQVPEDNRAEALYAVGRLNAQKQDYAKARAALQKLDASALRDSTKSPVYQNYAAKAMILLVRLPEAPAVAVAPSAGPAAPVSAPVK